MDRYTKWLNHLGHENMKTIWNKLHMNHIKMALKTINKEKEKFAIAIYPGLSKTNIKTYIDFNTIETMNVDDATELILITIEEIIKEREDIIIKEREDIKEELENAIHAGDRQKLQNKIKAKKNKIERLHEINKEYVEHKAEHDNLYVTESDTLFLEFMEVTIDELKDLSDKLAELDRYHNNLDMTVQEHDDKINELKAREER